MVTVPTNTNELLVGPCVISSRKMAEPESIGNWTEIKLHIIKEYAAAYTRILKEQSWCRAYAYIDAFAGPGTFVSREARERTIPGSPLNALNVDGKFTEYHFIDIERSRIDSLKDLVAGRPDVGSIHFYVGDANEVLVSKVLPQFRYNSFRRALCILDPYGVDIEWSTIESIAGARTMDLFINFPLMDINRNAALKTLEVSNPIEGRRFTKLWGDQSWKRLAYVEQRRLFEESVLIKKIKANETIKNGFLARLREKAGFPFLAEPILMRNTAGGPLYFLFFASHQRVAQKIAQDIFEKWGGA
jgi:three-Cys-motif partner protein